MTTAKAQRRAEKLFDRFQELVQGNAAWKSNVDNLVNQANTVLNTASKDRALVNLSDKVERFSDSLTRFASTGFSLVDGGGIWNDATQVRLASILYDLVCCILTNGTEETRRFSFLESSPR